MVMRNLLSPFIVYWLIRKWDHDCDIGWVKRLWHSEGIDMFISFRWKVWLVRWITFSVTSWFLLMLPLTSWTWFRSLQRIMHRCGPWAQRALVFNTSSLYIWESKQMHWRVAAFGRACKEGGESLAWIGEFHGWWNCSSLQDDLRKLKFMWRLWDSFQAWTPVSQQQCL